MRLMDRSKLIPESCRTDDEPHPMWNEHTDFHAWAQTSAPPGGFNFLKQLKNVTQGSKAPTPEAEEKS